VKFAVFLLLAILAVLVTGRLRRDRDGESWVAIVVVVIVLLVIGLYRWTR
jgi:predicted metal-binding membrane protein